LNLLIGIPTGGQPTRPFLDALRELQLPANLTDAGRLVWTGNSVAIQREMIAREAVARGADLLAMIDDDIIVPPDALLRLIAALEADPGAALAGGLYYSRDSARPIAVSRWDSSDTTSAAIPAFAGENVAVVDGVGFGCTVLRVAPLRAFSEPYFAAQVYVDFESRTARQCNEDYLYCERVRRAGWRVLLHAGVRLGHYDRASDKTAPAQWESDAETDRLRMIVRQDGGTKLVPFDDTLPRAAERQERFETTIVTAGELGGTP
jgi:glycosyl transferase family 2